MKIAIRSRDGKTVADSSTDFTGYLIYELVGEKVVNSEFRKGKSTSSADYSFISDCETVITKAISLQEKESFRKKGKEVLITFKTSPEEALQSFIKLKLSTGSFVH